MRIFCTLIFLSFVMAAPTAKAEPLGLLSEVKIGVMAHDVPFIAADTIESGADINAELLFVSPSFLPEEWGFRPHIGAQVNTGGYTSQVYAGLTWTYDFDDQFWFGFSGGGALHNGETTEQGQKRKAYGSAVLFRLAVEAGVNVTDNLSLSLYYDHESNAFLADENPGIDNMGVRLGWRF